MTTPRLRVVAAVLAGVAVAGLATGLALCSDGSPASAGRIVVAATWSGASPASIERDVLEPLERAVSAVDGVAALHGVATEGRAELVIDVAAGHDVDVIAAAIRERVEATRPTLPSDADHPVIMLRRPDVRPRRFVIPAQAIDGEVPAALRHPLLAVRGVVDVTMCGTTGRAVTVETTPADLTARNVTVDELVGALQTANVDVPAGRIDARGGDFTIRGHGATGGLDGISSLVVREQVRVSDVATVRVDQTRDCTPFAGAGTAAVGTVWRSTAAGGDDELTQRLDEIGGSLVDGSDGEITGWAELPAGHFDPTTRGPLLREQLLAQVPELETVTLQMPSSGGVMARAALHATLVPRSERRADWTPARIAEMIERIVKDHLGFGEVRLSGGGIVELEAVLTGDDMDMLSRDAVAAVTRLQADRHIDAAGCEGCGRIPAVHVSIDRHRAAELGVAVAAATFAIATATELGGGGGAGLHVGDLQLGGSQELAELRVRVQTYVQDVAALRVRGRDGTQVSLDAVATITQEAELAAIHREDGRRAVILWVRAAPYVDEDDLRAAIGAVVPGAAIRRPPAPAP